jgi:hypothetical protein
MPRVVSKMSIQVPKRPPGLRTKGIHEISGFRNRFATTITGGKGSVSRLDENLVLVVHSACPGTKEAGQVIPLAIANNVINVDSTHFFSTSLLFGLENKKSRMIRLHHPASVLLRKTKKINKIIVKTISYRFFKK